MRNRVRRTGGVLWLAGLCLLSVPAGYLPATAQEATPKQHDKAEAKQLIAQAEQAAAKITEKELKIDAQEDVAVSKAMAGDYEGARLIARVLGTDESKAKILQQMAIAQAVGGDTSTGTATIGGIKAPADKIEAACAMCRELDKLGRKDEAALVIAQMMEKVLPKLPDDFSILSSAFLLGDGLARAGMPELASNFAASFKGNPLTEEIGNALVTIAKAFHNDINGAKQKYAGLHTDGYKLAALTAIVEVQVKSGDKTGAAESWKQLTQMAQSKPAPVSDLVRVASLQQELGDLPAARATVESAMEIALKEPMDDTLGPVATAQAKLGDVDGALKTLGRIKDSLAQAAVLYSIAEAKAKTGDVPGALALAAPNADPYTQTRVLLGASQGILKSLKTAEKP